MEEAIVLLEQNADGDSLSLILYDRILQHFSAIERSNKSRVKAEFEQDLFEWLSPFYFHLKNPMTGRDKVIHSFPETYFPAKILAPELLTDSSLTIMAEKYPKEILYALRYMISPDALTEAELAAMNAPYEAKQYFHYHNSVNTLLKQSGIPAVKKLYEIFGEYRYGSNSFYLLHSIFKEDMTIEEAHETGKDREALYNAMVDIYTQDNALGRFSVEEHLSELSDKYVRKLMFQRYLSFSRINLDALSALSDRSRIYFLFRNQNLLKKKDLQNLSKFYQSLEMELLEEDDVKWLSGTWIVQFENRLKEEEMNDEFSYLIAESLWARPYKREDQLTFDIFPVVESILPSEAFIEPIYVFQPYFSKLSEDDKQLIRLENNPYELLNDLSQVTGKFYSRKIILSLALKYPIEVMAQLEKFQDQPYAADIVRHLTLNAPLTAKNYLVNKGHRIHTFLNQTPDDHILKLYEIDETLDNWTRAYILLDKIVNEELTIEEANSICKDKEQLLPYLVEMNKQEEYLGRYSVEMELEYAALNFIRQFNISENTDHTYRDELNRLDAATLYTFMICGEQEIINQSFQKMYGSLMSLEGDRLISFLGSMNYRYIDRFLRMTVHYGKESDLFQKLGPAGTKNIWDIVFRNLENSENEVHRAIEAGEIIVGLQSSEQLRDIHDIIREEYERLVKDLDDEGVAAYGVLASIMAQKLREGWSLQAAPYYRIPDLITIPVHQLFNEKLVNIQHYYFYNDRDGLYSYRNFLRQYERSDHNWKIEDKGMFVKISSKYGKSVEIYANKPIEDDEGIAQLEAYFTANQLEAQIIVHRGLSTHTLKTFRKIPESAKLILDGSCGGFHIQSVALENAPTAHILCNRNIGTMHINDPMFKQISESIRQGEDIVWPNFWRDMEDRLGTNPYFKDYIPPHKNVAALIIKAYYDVLDINN